MPKDSWNYDREKEKIKELHGVLKKHIKDYCDSAEELSIQVIKKCIRTSPPEQEQVVLHCILAEQHRFDGVKAKSLKPGNIWLNIGTLLEGISVGVLSFPTVRDIPWLIPFAGIILWNYLWRSSSIDIKNIDAAILLSMWKNKDENAEVQKESVFELYNNDSNAYNLSQITLPQLQSSLNNLVELGSIQTSEARPHNWWLCEWIKVTYK